MYTAKWLYQQLAEHKSQVGGKLILQRGKASKQVANGVRSFELGPSLSYLRINMEQCMSKSFQIHIKIYASQEFKYWILLKTKQNSQPSEPNEDLVEGNQLVLIFL